MDPKFPKEKNAQVTMNSFQKFVPPDQEPAIDIYTSNALDSSVRVKKCAGTTTSQLQTDQKPTEFPKTQSAE